MIFRLFVLLLPLLANAAPVSLDFESVSLPALTRLVVEEVGKSSYAFTPSFEECTKRVSVHLSKVDASVAAEIVFRLVEAEGFEVRRGPVVWIERPTAEQDFVYRPRFRSASYLSEVAGALFKQGALRVQSMGGVSAGVTAAGAAPGQNLPANAGSPAAQGFHAVADREFVDILSFRGLVADVERLRSVLAQLDSRAPEVLVKAVVYEVAKSHGEHSALSLAFSILGGKLQVNAGRGTAGDWSAIFQNSSLSAVFDALSTDSRFHVVSQPQLRVTSGASAKLTVGTQTPVISSSSLDRNGNAVQSVEYRPSGVILDLRPDVRGDVAQLRIDQQISQFQQTTTGVNASPTLITRQLQTSVSMAANEVLVLGGLNEEKNQDASSGLSWLPAFLRATSGTRETTEVLVFLELQRI